MTVDDYPRGKAQATWPSLCATSHHVLVQSMTLGILRRGTTQVDIP
jgi:hypothetical protein